jgi:L-ascorbate metabolism protein UlaG (beta-lactamase superfamily)
MTTRCTYWGASCFELAAPRHRVLIDPYLTGNPYPTIAPEDLEPPDLIVITHASWDHFGDAAEIARRTGAGVIADPASKALLLDRGVPAKQVRTACWGIALQVGPTLVRPLVSQHMSVAELSTGEVVYGTPLALMVETEPGVCFFHFGDTSIYDMTLFGELYQPTVGLIGCTLPRELMPRGPSWSEHVTGQLSSDEAARLAEMLGVKLVLACHYLGVPDTASRRFVELVPKYDSSGTRGAFAPEIGDTFTVEADGWSQTGNVFRP